MPSTQGKVRYLKVHKGKEAGDDSQSDYAFLGVVDADDMTHYFLLWYYELFDDVPTAFERVTHSMWVSMIRDAMNHDHTIVVLTTDLSSYVDEILITLIP